MLLKIYHFGNRKRENGKGRTKRESTCKATILRGISANILDEDPALMKFICWVTSCLVSSILEHLEKIFNYEYRVVREVIEVVEQWMEIIYQMTIILQEHLKGIMMVMVILDSSNYCSAVVMIAVVIMIAGLAVTVVMVNVEYGVPFGPKVTKL
ncbi:hypothetical protein C1646_753514 [Rhizophagus diaphanus]|nr:hypothetical protein C1646_753514 [Rhizophagus diaphanus] [Rhizophagus sp. MUCL 43196]